jgi:hypothetical protein
MWLDRTFLLTNLGPPIIVFSRIHYHSRTQDRTQVHMFSSLHTHTHTHTHTHADLLTLSTQTPRVVGVNSTHCLLFSRSLQGLKAYLRIYSDSIMSPPPTIEESGLFENTQTWGCYDGPKGLIMHSMDFFTDAGKDS